MKKYSMIIFYVLMSIVLVFPLTMQAEEEKEYHMMKSQEGEHMMKKPGGPMGHHDWFSSLNLDEAVLKKVQEMRLKNKEKILELKNQIEKKELEMEKILMEKELDLNKILSIHDEISNLRQKISRKMIEQKIETYKLLPDDKKEEAKKLFLHRFLGKRHGKWGMHGKTEMHGEEGKPGCPMNK